MCNTHAEFEVVGQYDLTGSVYLLTQFLFGAVGIDQKSETADTSVQVSSIGWLKSALEIGRGVQSFMGSS